MNACRSVCGLIGLAMPGTFGDAAHGPAGAVPVKALPVGAEEGRPVEAFADG